MIKVPTSVAIAALLLASSASAQTDQDTPSDPQSEWGERNTSYLPAFDAQFRAPIVGTQAELDVETIVDGLVHPWGSKTSQVIRATS